MRILALIFALSAPAIAAETTPEITAETAPATVTYSEVKVKVRPENMRISKALRSWLKEAQAERGAPTALTCQVEVTYNAEGRFDSLTVLGCPDEVVAMTENELHEAYRRSRIVLPEGADSLRVTRRLYWQVQ